jgi:hypothetical protein
VRVTAFPLSRTKGDPPPIAATPPMKLAIASTKKNLVVDDGDWFAKNHLTPAMLRPRPDQIPEYVASTMGGAPLEKLFVHADHRVALYGSFVGVFAPGKTPLVYDVQDLLPTHGATMEVGFGELVGETLVLSISHNGYARDVNGQHAFVVAIAPSGAIAWASDPLVSNAASFVVTGSHLVTGYGFTAEPDALFVVDLTTGATEQKLPLGSGPDWVLRKGDDLFVRTYDTDVIVHLPANAPGAPPAKLADAPPSAARAPTADQRCLVDRAIAAIDARDEAALARTVGPVESVAPTLAKALSGADRFLAKAADGTIDLTTVEVIRAEDPPWEYVSRVPAPAEKEKPPKLVRVVSASADPVRLSPKDVAPPSGIIRIAPIEHGKIPRGGPAGIPTSYGGEDLRAIIPSGDRTVLVYGGRYVAVLHGQSTERVFDFEAYLHPPKADPKWKEFAVEDVTFAQVSDGALVVANGGGSYARDVFGKKGFMSAIDYATGKLLWRSDPLVCDESFVVSGPFVFTGYGFTEEPDFLYVLSLTTGRTLDKIRLDTAPSEISLSGDRLVVEAYANHYEFTVQR